jgi:hypothetical protein
MGIRWSVWAIHARRPRGRRTGRPLGVDHPTARGRRPNRKLRSRRLAWPVSPAALPGGEGVAGIEGAIDALRRRSSISVNAPAQLLSTRISGTIPHFPVTGAATRHVDHAPGGARPAASPTTRIHRSRRGGPVRPRDSRPGSREHAARIAQEAQTLGRIPQSCARNHP